MDGTHSTDHKEERETAPDPRQLIEASRKAIDRVHTLMRRRILEAIRTNQDKVAPGPIAP